MGRKNSSSEESMNRHNFSGFLQSLGLWALTLSPIHCAPSHCIHKVTHKVGYRSKMWCTLYFWSLFTYQVRQKLISTPLKGCFPLCPQEYHFIWQWNSWGKKNHVVFTTNCHFPSGHWAEFTLKLSSCVPPSIKQRKGCLAFFFPLNHKGCNFIRVTF